MSLRKIVLGTLGVTSAVLITTATVYAASTDTDDHLSVPTGTTVTGALKTGTNMVFHGTINGVPITVNCKTFSASGKTPAKGITVTLPAPPTISGCTDTIGGTDTLKTNQTNAKWKLKGVDAPNDENQTEPNTGDKLTLIIPKAGATFTSSVLPGCTLTAAPSASAGVAGKYDDVNTDTVTNASIAVTAAGCSASTAKVSATVVLSPGFNDVS